MTCLCIDCGVDTYPLDDRRRRGARAAAASSAGSRSRARAEHQGDLFGHVAAKPRRPMIVDREQVEKWAAAIWRSADDPRDVEMARHFFAANNLELTAEIACSVVRYHASMRFGDSRSPGLVFLLRKMDDNSPTGVLRYFLDSEGALIGRKVLGSAWNGAIKLSDRTDVDSNLFIASRIEPAIRAMNAGHRPVWCVGANAVAELPVIPNVQTLTLIGCDARAAAIASRRWREADRNVVVLPCPP